jgi:hypothetical protein
LKTFTPAVYPFVCQQQDEWLTFFKAVLKLLTDSSVSIVMGYNLDGWGWIPGRGKRFFFTPQCPDQFCGPQSLPDSEYWRFFPLGKEVGARSWLLTSC